MIGTPPTGTSAFDISPDGQRLLMIKEDATTEPPPEIHVVTNWFEELKARVPTP